MRNVRPEELVQFLKNSFIKENSLGVDTCIQVNMLGENTSQWFITIKDQTLDVQQGKSEKASAVINIDMDDFLGLLSGRLDPVRAFLLGKVRITGDQSAVMRLVPLFRINPDELAKLRG